MAEPPELSTARLLLRPFRLSDIDDVLAYASDPEWPAFYSRPYDRGAVEYMVARAVLTSWDKEALFAIVLEDRVIGLVDLDVDPKSRSAELGYDIARDMWGQGLALEAATAVCDWGFREFGLAKVWAWANARNRRSLRVMEKLGMTREGLHRSCEAVRGEWVDGACYSVLRSEWSGSGGPLTPIPMPAEEYDTTDRGDSREMTTPRLVLRPFEPDDVDDLFEYAKDPDWAEYLPDSVPQPYTRRNAEEFIARQMLASPDVQSSWAIVLDGTGIGGVTLNIDSRHETGEIHYALAKTHWGRGFMPEAAGAVVDWGFGRRGLVKISTQIDVANRQSRRVVEKLGMRREGVSLSHHKDPRPDHPRIDRVYYGLLREEWEQVAGGRAELDSCDGRTWDPGHAAEDRHGAEGVA